MSSTPQVVVVGSLHHDILVTAPRQPARGETLIGTHWQPKFGGKGGNQAVSAAAQGARVAMVGAVGCDGFAEMLLAELAEAGVDASAVERRDDVGSGMSVAILDAEGDYAAVVVSGANMMLDPQRVAAAPQLGVADVVLLQNEVPETVNRAAAKVAHHHGALVIWNAAPARADTVALAPLADILVVNEVEAAQLTGHQLGERSSGALAAAHALQSAGTATVIVTLGAEGLVTVGKDGFSQKIPAIPVRNPQSHGAGDAFVGALAAALAVKHPIVDALHRASHFAAAHVAGVPRERVHDATVRNAGR